MIDLEAIRGARVNEKPFKFLVARNILAPSDLKQLKRDFPLIEQPGTFPLQELEYGPSFARLVEQLRSKDFTYLMGKKFRINLTMKPLFISVRGYSRLTDGKIHTDAKSKVVSCTLYLNDEWKEPAGRLCMLRNSYSFNRAYTKVPPDGGTLVALRRSDRSWHGHLPYEGPRRSVMFNWMRSRNVTEIERVRHRVSSRIKRSLA
ncbi:MAG: 2OG-Fe(II) oxygenase [Methyloligellaceae bacterium]